MCRGEIPHQHPAFNADTPDKQTAGGNAGEQGANDTTEKGCDSEKAVEINDEPMVHSSSWELWPE